MLTEYIQKAMENAHYEIIEDEGTFWGEIPGFQGVWAKAETLEKCRETLQEALEEWIIFRNRHEIEIGVGFLKRLLKQAGITEKDWLNN
jgi:predicted RNase H-like HicB family nuclease